MARTVLVMAALVALCGSPAGAASICPAGTGDGATDTLTMAEHSPLYALATRLLGPAASCKASKASQG